jgi:hypothetical protein
MGDESSEYVYPWSARRIGLSKSEKAEGLAECLELPPGIEIKRYYKQGLAVPSPASGIPGRRNDQC